MLPTRLFGLTFPENGLQCYLLGRAFALDKVQQDWSMIYLAAYYWSMHYQQTPQRRGRGTVPLIQATEEDMLRDWFGARLSLFNGWDGSAECLNELLAKNLGVLIPTDKHPFVKRFANVFGTDIFMLLDVDDDDLIFYGPPHMIPPLHALHDTQLFDGGKLVPWIPGGSYGLAKKQSFHTYIGDVYAPFPASRAAVYKRNRVLREKYNERYASIQLLNCGERLVEDPKLALLDLIHHTLGLNDDDLRERVLNKAAYLQQMFTEEAALNVRLTEEEVRILAMNFINSQSIAVGTLFLALGKVPCEANTVKAIDAALHRVIDQWTMVFPILASRSLPKPIVDSLVAAERRFLDEVSTAMADSKASVRRESVAEVG